MTPMDKQHLLTWRGTGLTDIGRTRSTNQDAFLVDDQLGLWIVADGMGGRAGGDVASQTAIASMKACFQAGRISDQTDPDATDGTIMMLRRAVEAGHETIRTKARTHPELEGMGSTVVALCLLPGQPREATCVHIGDSRAYLLRGDSLTQLTRDHSLVGEYVARGLVSPEEALTHPQRHLITRALGIEGQAEPDLASLTLQEGDLILLCTDGLTKALDDKEILKTLLRGGQSPEAVCGELVDAANQRGGKDNITVLVIYEEASS